MQYDGLVGNPIFRVAMLGAAIFLLWIVISVPREVLGRRRRGNHFDLQTVAEGHAGEIHQVAANVRSVLPAMVAVLATAVQLLSMAVLGSNMQIGDWIHWGRALMVTGLWIVIVRQLGWPNLLVPSEVRKVPGLFIVRVQKWRGSPDSDDAGGG